jgi:hypothetical protein
MEAAGASPDAISFSRSGDGEAFLMEFRELGRVDVGVMRAFSYNDPALAAEDVFLNGESPVVRPVDHAQRIDLRTDPRSRGPVRRFPNLALWGPYRFVAVQPMAKGGKRFLFDGSLLAGCRACEIAGTAKLAFDFDDRGRFPGAELIAVEERASTKQAATKFATCRLACISGLRGLRLRHLRLEAQSRRRAHRCSNPKLTT